MSARPRAARIWAERRRVEFESAQRFAHLTTELTSHGSSTVIVEMARDAARDELRHAELCEQLMQHFGGPPAAVAHEVTAPRRVAPAELDAREALLYELVALSCVTETLSTVLLGTLVDAARDPFTRQCLHSILKDEVQHSRLGWAFLAEAHAGGARDVVSPHLPAMLAATLGTEAVVDAPPDADDAELSGYGALDRTTGERLVRECLAEVVFPGLERFGIDTVPGKRWLASRASGR
jgi:ferritin-like protein